ncbi:hypothetical protein FHR24_002756 [Wenyingzhuangia heitensis]|uniref:40-residue YVTN family beta-propeller repeat-containing protein n=1 Tax=Wenyingzhuangia heitensis TaxID=1487859 RepID=A0ABX0UBR6_9FLAO|nr:cell surface protein [Wenyingzhuangia heitensis]NIJ46272.1 hypothetical protein [Wenyingzhuangia heitensis]
MKTNSIFKLLLLSSIVFTSCTKEETITETITQNIFETINSDIIVSSEGNFGAKDGSVSYFGKNNTDVFYYENENGAKAAGLIQSICFGEEDAYIILNDVSQIIVVDKNTFKKKAIVQTGLGNPRYMTIVGDKGYITNWGSGSDETDDYIAVLDLTTNTIEETTIPLANGVERVVTKNNKLYVSHQGGFSSNNIVSVVDLGAGNSITTVTVKDNPDELFFNNAGELVVLSQGKPLTYGGAPDYPALTNTTSSISFINIADNTINKELVFTENTRATLMSYDNGNIYYYVGDKVFMINDNSTEISTSKGISVGSIYGMSTKQNYLFTVSYSFTSLCKFNIVNVSTLETEYSSAVGLGASKVYFIE